MNIGRVLVNGVELARAKTEYDFTFRHGRSDIEDGPTPSSCSLSMVGVSRADLVKAGDSLVVELAQQYAPQNLVPNGDFEVDTAGWTGENGITFSRSAEQSKTGVYAGKGASNGSGFGYVWVNVPLTAGMAYSFTFWVVGVAAKAMQAFLWYPAFTLVPGTGIGWTGSAAWQKLTIPTFTAAATANHLFVVMVNAPVAGDAFYIDDVRAEKVPATMLPLPIARRFTGRVSDVSVDEDRLELIGIGALTALGASLPEATLPAELASVRLVKLFTDIGARSAPINLVPNGEFETNTTGWYVAATGGMTGAALSRVTDLSKHGAASLRITALQPADTSFRRLVVQTEPGTGGIPVAVGLSYRVGAWVYSVDPSVGTGDILDWNITVIWYDAAGTALAAVPAVSFLGESAAWRLIEATFTAPATAAYVAPVFYVYTNTANDLLDLRIDAVDMRVVGGSWYRLELDATLDPLLAARDREPTTAYAEVIRIADSLGLAVYDDADGMIHVQALNGRGAAGVLELDPALVEYAPTWGQTGAVENRVTVATAAGALSLAESAESVAKYGPQPSRLDTDLANSGDAATRANQRLARRAFPRWMMPELRHLALSTAITVGRQVGIGSLPASAPYARFEPVVEGWVDDVGPDYWTTELALSDPALSGLTLKWSRVTASLKWSGALGTWSNATSNAEIGG